MLGRLRIKKLSKHQILLRYGWTEDQLKGLPDEVLQALYAYSVSDVVDLQELDRCLEAMGFGVEEVTDA